MALQPSELSVLHDDVDLDRDRVLVERCQSGDSSAFGELYSRYYARAYRFCFRRLHDHEEAEDVAQDAFARAWRALPTFAGERRFYPWLTVIADNRCRDIQRRLVSKGYRVRIYIPYGKAWYPYFMRRLAERPANVLFLVRNLFR